MRWAQPLQQTHRWRADELHTEDLDDPSDLGIYLSTQRRRAGWTQEQLAARSGVSIRTVRNLETGSITNPRRSSVRLLLEAFEEQEIPPAEAGADALIGRSTDFQHVQEALRRARHVVLTGPGGVGKTMLALAVARHLRPRLREQTAVISLGSFPAETPGLDDQFDAVWAAINDALASSSPGAHPAGHELLLVLDNAEHLVRSVSRAFQRLFVDHPGVRVLVTSRRPLPIAFMHVWDVRPLDVEPAGDGLLPDATLLFLRRAQANCPTLDLSGSLAAVTELCRRLDGIPALIELAARRIRSMSLDTLLGIYSLTRVLGQMSQSAYSPHRSLSDSVRWSVELLTESQTEMLQRLALFDTSFTLDELQQHAIDCLADPNGLADMLSELIDSSLVQVSRESPYVYRLYGHLREYLRWQQVSHQAR